MNMKTNSFFLLTAGVVAALAPVVRAIESPADDAPPPPVVQPPVGEKAAGQADKPELKPDIQPAAAESAYLGVATSDVPDLLAAHLGLKPGEGIVVQGVMPDGPAAKAGIAKHDVITRLAGQPVASAEDLSAKVREHRPGEVVRLNVIREGKASETDVTLGSRPAEVAGIRPEPLGDLNLQGLPKELADRVRGVIEGNLGAMEWQPGDAGAFEAPPQMEDAMRQMKERMEKAMQGLAIPKTPDGLAAEGQHAATIRLMDEQGSIELKSTDGSKEVTIRDKENHITWTGPWDTEQDRAAAPADVRQRVERLNLDTRIQGNGIHLRGGFPPLEIQPGGAGE